MKYISGIFSLVAVAIIFMAAAPAEAAVELRFTPADTTIAMASPGRLAIYVDEVIDLRTVDITASYDTSIITSVSGAPGALFTDSGFFLWNVFEEDTPGIWHGFSVIMGAEDYITGPGELYVWDITGKANGFTDINALEVRLFNPAGAAIDSVTLPPTTINVGEAVPAQPVPLPFPGKLTASPNPFNPRTNIQFELPEAASVHLAVYDARGRMVKVLMDRYADAGNLNVTWDGKNSTGLDQPGGVYFFLMETELGRALTKAVLIK